MQRIKYTNATTRDVYVQIDPWAASYLLSGGQTLEIEIDCTHGCVIDIDEHGDSRIITLAGVDTFRVVVDGVPLIWTDYPSSR